MRPTRRAVFGSAPSITMCSAGLPPSRASDTLAEDACPTCVRGERGARVSGEFQATFPERGCEQQQHQSGSRRR